MPDETLGASAEHDEFVRGEIQHDTSPHWAHIDGVLTRVQSASFVLCHSRMVFFKFYPRFTRSERKAFLAAAFASFNSP